MIGSETDMLENEQQHDTDQQTEETFTKSDIDEAVNQALANRDEAERIQQERTQAMERLDSAFAEANNIKKSKELLEIAETRLNNAGLPSSLASMVQNKDTRIMNERIAIVKALIQTEAKKSIKKSLAGKVPEKEKSVSALKQSAEAQAFHKELNK
ncbi:capsid assembly scaffolding protein Gp46 family protein [Bacillus thuringiensis]|uniref:capsid assembly scaffolding protein Gp46 family protein n=2 Tax=Bacillati TaxID=1783272 RepID=UPI0035E01735